MANLIEQFIAWAWNWIASKPRKAGQSDLIFGNRIRDGQATDTRVGIPENRRTEHVAILGKTGSGKSSLLRQLVLQDIRADRGFVFFDLHGDAQGFLLKAIVEEERRRNSELSRKLIVIEPADLEYSVGLNVLEPKGGHENFVQISEFAQILKSRWHLDALGARTEELLRNTLHVLSENHLTFLELPSLLTNAAFRSDCLKRVGNPEVRAYFESRYDRVSEAMQSSFREAVLNKVTAFTADPRFRHILGQQHSSFSLLAAMDRGYWIVLNLDKGRLGEEAATLGSLFLAKLKNAVFGRRSRTLFTLYCDEIQNLLAFDSGLSSLLSEARKFGISVVCANQFLEQYPPQMKAAIMAVGTHVLFQLSSDDATKMSQALGGGRQLGEILRYLPHRQVVIKSGHHRYSEALVPEVKTPDASAWSLYERCRKRWAKPRRDIEREIQARSAEASETKEALDGWN